MHTLGGYGSLFTISPNIHSMKKELIVRLARIEGQVAALKRSLESEADTDCASTLVQIKAASSGLKRSAELVAREHAHRCISGKMGRGRFSREIDAIINSAFSLS